MKKSKPVQGSIFNSAPRNPLILKKLSQEEQIHDFVLVGGPFDGRRYRVDIEQTQFELYHNAVTHAYHKTSIEDQHGNKVSFFRHQTLSDVSAVIRCIENYKS